jgi:hypothetical protein
MKLKAVWKTDACQAIASSVQSILTGGDRCTIKFSPNRYVQFIYLLQLTRVFIASLTKRKDQTESWIVLESTQAFSSLVCESLRQNEIDLALPTSAILMVLKYTTTCVFCATRLTKRDSEPVLRFEFNFIDTGNSLVFHDIPVEVLRLGSVWSEPVLPDPTVHISLNTSFKRTGVLFDRLKHMGMSDACIKIIKQDSVSDIMLVSESESSRASFVIHGSTLVQGSGELPGQTQTTEISVTLSGIAFVLSKVAAPGNLRCMLMACENRYVSAWVQLPQRYGVVAAVTPALLTG